MIKTIVEKEKSRTVDDEVGVVAQLYLKSYIRLILIISEFRESGEVNGNYIERRSQPKRTTKLTNRDN